MKHSYAFTAAAAVLLIAGPTSAQSFLEGLARRATQAAVTRMQAGPTALPPTTEDAAEQDFVAPSTSTPARVSSGAGQAPSAFPELAPINYEPSMWSPIQMRFAESVQKGEERFDEFNHVSCNDCEGLRAYESWVRHILPEYRETHALSAKIGAMAIGEAIRWSGRSGARLALTVVGDEPVGRWECKQVRWTSERAGQSAQRLGLFCNDNEDRHRWEEVV